MRLRKPNFTKLPSGSWRARYYVPDELRSDIQEQGLNIRPSKAFPSKYQAQEWARAELRALELGTWIHPNVRETEKARQQLTVRDWLDTYADNQTANGNEDTTVQKFRQVVRNRITDPRPPGDLDPDVTALADMKLTAVTKRDVHNWWHGIARAYLGDQSTNQRAYKHLRAAYAEAVQQGIVQSNPIDVKAAKRKRKPEEKYLPTDDELRRIMQATLPQHKAATSLTLYHGLRISEALGLERDDVKVTYPNGTDAQPEVRVTVKQASARLEDSDRRGYMVIKKTKSAAGMRTIKIMDAHVPLFIEHLDKYAPRSKATFDDQMLREKRTAQLFIGNTNDGLLLHGSFRKALDAAKKRAGVDTKITPHSGRNWLITRLAENGAHLKSIGAIMGQSDHGTIMHVYMKVKVGYTDELMDTVSGTIE